MTAYAFYFFGGLVTVFLLGFLGYYAYRLATVKNRRDDSSERRLQQMIRAEVAGSASAAGPVSTSGSAASAGLSPSDPATMPRADSGAPPTGSPDGAPRLVYERGPGLRKFSEEPVFMRRDRAGEVSFQLGEKPPMPLKFLLDPHGRKVLGDLSMRATVDFGQTWAILAAEDEGGRLTVTRLA